MAAPHNEPIGREASEDLSKARRVTINSSNKFALAGAGSAYHALTIEAANSGRECAARLVNSPAIVEVTAAGSCSVGDRLYPAASGKVSNSVSGSPQFVAVQSASGDGEIIEALPLADLSDGSLRTEQVAVDQGTSSSDFQQYLSVAAAKVLIQSVEVVSDTSCSSDDGSNNWSFQAQNLTDGEALVSSALNTGDDSILNTADQAYELGVDQNNTLQADDVLELQVTSTGTPTDLSSAVLHATVTYRVLE